MRVLSVFIAGLLIIYPNGLLFAEVVLEKPMPIVSGARSIRTPQQIIADFQATVEKIQSEQQNLYTQIEMKDKENALLLKKLNDMSARLSQVQDELSQKSSGAEDASQLEQQKLLQEKNEIQAKYDQVMAEKSDLEQKIKDLKDQRQTLAMAEQDSLSKLQSALDASQAKVQEQQSAIETLVQERNDLDSKRLAAIGEKEEIEQQINDLQDQLAQAKIKEEQKPDSNQTSLQLRIRELSDQLDRMEDEIRAKDNAIARFKGQAAKAESELKRALLEKENSREQIQKLTSTYNTAQDGRSEKISRLEKRLQEAQEETKRLSQERSQAKEELEASQAEQKALNRKIDSLKAELAKARGSVDSEVRDAKEPLIDRIEALKKSLDQKESESQKKVQQMEEMRQKNEALVKQLNALKTERDSLQRSLDALQSGPKSDDRSDLSPEMQEQAKMLKADIADKDRELKEKAGMIDALKAEKSKLASRVEELTNQRNDLKAQLSRYRDTSAGKDVKVSETNSSKATQLLEEKVEKLTRNLKDREEIIKEKESLITQLKAEHAEASNKLVSAENQKKTLQVMIDSLETQLSDSAENGSEPNQKSALQIAELKGELKARVDETQEAKSNVEKLDRQLAEERKQREIAQKEAAVMQERIKAQETVLDSKISAKTDPLHETIAKLNAKIKELTDAVEAKDRDLADLRTQKEMVQENLIASNGERKSLEDKVAQLESRLSAQKDVDLSGKAEDSSDSTIKEKWQSAVEELAQKDKQLQEYKERNERLDERISRVDQERLQSEQTIKRLNDELARLKSDSQEKIDNVQAASENRIKEAQKTTAEAQSSLKEKEVEIASLNAKVGELDKQVVTLTRENEELAKSSAERSAGKPAVVSKESDSLKVRIAQLEKERGGYESQIKRISADSDRLKKDLQAAQRSQEQLTKSLEQNTKKNEAAEKNSAAQKAELEAKIADLTKRNNVSEQQLKELKQQLAQNLKNSNPSNGESSVKWKAKFDQVSRELSAALANVKTQEKRASELKARNDQLDVSIVSLKDDLSQKDKDLTRAESQREEFVSQIEILTKDRVNMEQRVKDLTQQVVNLQAAQSGEITSVKSEATQKTADLAMKLADAVGQVQTSDLKIQQLTEKQKKLEEQLVEANSVKDQNQDRLQSSLKENEFLRKSYEQQIDQLKQEALRFGSERDAQVMKVNELENAIKDGEKVFQEKQGGLAGEIEKLRGLLTDRDAEIKQSKQRVAELEKSKEEAEVKLAAAQASERDIAKELETARSNLTGKEADSKLETAAVEQELRKKISDLNGQLDITKDEAEELKKSKSTLEESIVEKEKMIEGLQTRLTEKEKVLEEKSTQAAQETEGVKTELKSEIDQLRSGLKESQAAVKELTRQKGALENELKSSNDKVQGLQAQLTDKQKTLESRRTQMSQEAEESKAALEAQVKQLSQELEASQKSAEELSRTKAALENDLKSQKAVVAQLESEKQQQIEALTSSKAQLSDEATKVQNSMESQIKDLSAQLKASQETVRDVQAKNQELEKANGQVGDQMAALQSQMKEYQEQLKSAQVLLSDKETKGREAASALEKELKGRIEEMAEQLKTARSETTAVQKAKEVVESQLKDKDRTIEELQTGLAEKEKSWRDSESLASKEASDIKMSFGAQIQQLNAEVQKSQKTIEELTLAKTGLEGSLDSSDAKIVQLQALVAEKEKALASDREKMSREMADSKASLQSQIDRLSVELKESQQAHSELAKAKSVLEEQFVSVDKKAAQLTGQIAEKENEISSYKEKSVQEMDKTKAGLQSEIDRLNADLQAERQGVKDLKASKTELQDRLQAAQAQVVELQKESEQKQKDLDSTKAQAAQENEKLKKSLQAEIDSLTTELRGAQASVDELTKTRAQLSAGLTDAEGQVTQLTAQVQDKERSLADMSSKNEQELAEKEKTFNGQLTGLKDELTKTKDELRQVSGLKENLEKELKAATQRVDGLTTDLAAKTKEWEDLSASMPNQLAAAKKPLEEKIDGMVKSLEDAQTQLKNKQTAADDLTKKVADLEKSLSETASAKEKAQQESSAAKADLETMQKETTAKIEEAKKQMTEKYTSLENALKNKDGEIAALNQVKEKMSAQLNQLAAEKDKLQKESAALKSSVEEHEKSLEKKIDTAKQPLLEELDKLQKMLDEKEQLIEQKAEAFTKLSGELSTVLKGLAVVREERDNLSLRVKPLEEQVSGIPNEVALAKKPLEDENAKLRLELEKVQGMLDVRVQGLEADLEAKNSAYNEAVASRRSLEKDIERLNQESAKLTQENQRMELKLSKKFQEDCGVSMEELQKPWKDKIEELKALLDGRDKEIESFKNENARLNQELGGLAPSSN